MADVRFEVTCPSCETPFHVPLDEQGKIAECPKCDGWVDVPELARPPSPAEVDEAAARNLREYERQLAEAARQIEQSQHELDKRDELNARLSLLLDRMEAVVGQWEQLATHVGRVVERLGN